MGLRVLPPQRPDDGRGRLRAARSSSTPSILGAIGDPRVPDHISVWELILPLRQRFDQYVNLRPMRLLPGVDVAAREPRRGRHRHGLRARELRGRVRRPRRPAARRHAARSGRADRHLHAARHRADRALRVRGRVASARESKLASATKSNALQHSMVLWDEVVEEVREGLPDGRVAEVPRRRARRAHGHRSRQRST